MTALNRLVLNQRVVLPEWTDPDALAAFEFESVDAERPRTHERPPSVYSVPSVYSDEWEHVARSGSPTRRIEPRFH